MKSSKYPVRNLIRLYLGMAVTSFSLVLGCLFLMLGPGYYNIILILSLLAFISLIIKGFINLGVIFFLDKYIDSNTSLFKKLRYSLTIFFNVCFESFIFIGLASINDLRINLLFLLTVAFTIFVMNIIIILLQDYVILNHFKTQIDLENSQLKTAKAEAANQLLRQQIHPHFLFNALNTIKSLYKIDPNSADEYIVRLSDFLRASISKNSLETITLKEEIKLCIDYLEMQKIRFGTALQYSISVPEVKLENSYVPAFSIQSLLENAIKHNGLTEESPLTVTIRSSGDRISVINNLQYKVSTEPSAGTGLTNLAERYRIISKDELIVENDSHSFSVSIKILENGDSNNRR